jgi:nitrogen-specific signal transduction histidine kinase/CheY-like chemotaxis protein
LGIAHDVSARKRAESERGELERKMQETQKLESLGVLAGGIAHDFNNLLTGILGNASLARLELPPEAPVGALVAQIEEAGLRAAELCQQMLAYSGKGRFVVQPFALGRLVEETARLLHLSISKKARLVLNLQAGTPQVCGDATQLRQVVMNLVINAAEALGPREGEIAVSVREVHPSRARLALMHGGDVAAEGAYVELAVRDTGCGMSPATVARIFEPFFTTKFTGRGLGLSAVLGIVRSHHGALEVSSTPGHGTTFTVLLPAVAGVLEAPAAPVSETQWHGSGTVLVADDEGPVREVLAHMLRRMGFTVETAEDGRAAVTLFQRQPDRYAAVLLDLSMPRCDGSEALREIRALRPEAVVVLMTGHGCSDVSERLAEDRPSAVVQKPFTTAAIREALCGALQAPVGKMPA